jgi:hypothetical protein
MFPFLNIELRNDWQCNWDDESQQLEQRLIISLVIHCVREMSGSDSSMREVGCLLQCCAKWSCIN